MKLADNAKSRHRAWYMYHFTIWVYDICRLQTAVCKCHTPSQYTQLHEKHNAQYKNKYITVTLLNKIERIRRIFTAISCYHSSSQRSLSPFWLQLLTIFSSFIGKEDFYHRQLLVFRIVKIKNHCCHTDYQPHKSCDFQTWYTFFCSNSYRLYTYTPDIPICHWVYEVLGLWMSWQVPLFFFVFADQSLWKHSVLF